MEGEKMYKYIFNNFEVLKNDIATWRLRTTYYTYILILKSEICNLTFL